MKAVVGLLVLLVRVSYGELFKVFPLKFYFKWLITCFEEIRRSAHDKSFKLSFVDNLKIISNTKILKCISIFSKKKKCTHASHTSIYFSSRAFRRGKRGVHPGQVVSPWQVVHTFPNQLYLSLCFCYTKQTYFLHTFLFVFMASLSCHF